MCHVAGFMPYFYIAAPPGFKAEHIVRLRSAVNVSTHRL